MSTPPIKLYAFAFSPFVQKVAAILDTKRLPYQTVYVHPTKKGEIAFSRRKLVPIIDDGGEIVEDSTEIALYLESKVPDPQLIPDDRAQRATVFALERWLDDTFFPRFYVPMFWGIPANRERALDVFLATSSLSKAESFLLPRFAGVMMRDLIAKAQSDLFRLAAALDEFETRLGSGPFLGEQAHATLADIAAFAAMSVVTDGNFEGAERLRERPALHAWMERVRPFTSPGTRLVG
jgi:glutathione S-transferase